MNRNEHKDLIEELIWLKEYSDPLTNADLGKEENRIWDIELILISELKIKFEKYNKKPA